MVQETGHDELVVVVKHCESDSPTTRRPRFYNFPHTAFVASDETIIIIIIILLLILRYWLT